MGTASRFGVVVMVLALWLAGCAAARAEEEGSFSPMDIKEIEVGPALTPSSPPMAVKLWADRESNRYRVGETVVFFVETNRDCYLTLLNIGTSGQVRVLFPNSFQKANAVLGDIEQAVPGETATFEFTLAGPPGVEGVTAICALDNFLMAAGTSTRLGQVPYRSSGDHPTATTKDIEVQLKRIPKGRWAMATTSLEVEPRDYGIDNY
jgi:hypothetical protein